MAKQKAQKDPEAKVTPIIDGAYELVNMEPIKVSTGIGDFDLSDLTAAQADSLIDIGCKWIRKKEAE